MPVQVYRSDQVGAPSLTGQIGSMIALLDACLINGYGDFSISNITRVGTVVTVTCAAAHNLASFDTARLSGANEAEYNADFTIQVVDATTFTFAAPDTFPANATGTVSGKRAPAGFEIKFASANGYKKVYRSLDPASRKHYFQVNDDAATFSSGSQTAGVVGYTHMVDVDCGVGRFPATNYANRGFMVLKSTTTDATARAWVAISDGRTLYFIAWPSQAKTSFSWTNGVKAWAFGELNAPWDPWASFCSGATSDSAALTTSSAAWAYNCASSYVLTTTTASFAIARDSTGNGGATNQAALFGQASSNGSAFSAPTMTDGSAQTESMFCCPIRVAEGGHSLTINGYSSAIYRGQLAGVYDSSSGSALLDFAVHRNFEGLEGRRMLNIPMNYDGYVGTGYFLFDITGPWY